MKKIIFSAIIFSFLFAAAVFAQETDLPSPGLTPDSPFYFLKSWKESIQTFFTFGAENKARQFLHLAEVRLAEYQKMIEKNKTEIAQKTLDKYERQLNRAVEKAQEVQKKEGTDDVTNAIQERKTKHQGILTEVLTKAPEETKQKMIEKGSEKWTEFITEVREKFPELISGPVEIKNIPVQVLLGCSVPSVPRPEDCEGGWLLNQSKGCPYFSCPSAIKRPVSEPPAKPAESSVQPPESKVCVQVITPAIGPDGKCKEFGTPCDVPESWKKVDKCPFVSVPSAPSTPPKPPVSSEPIPTEIRYYTCPDGTKVESGKCYGTGERSICSIVSSPELQCIAQAPPVPNGGTCTTTGETKYYTCADGAKVTWCMCGPESGLVGAKNIWRCQHLPELSCPKPALTPAPAEVMVGCCLSDGVCQFETKEHCNLKNGKEVSSCTAELCPKPAPVPAPAPNPTTDYIYSDCIKEGMKTYKCPAGNIINWKCSCQVSEPIDPKYRSGGYTTWSCSAEAEKYCPINSETPLAVTLLYLKYYKPTSVEVCWAVNKAIISRYVEYGPTVSYGFRQESGSSDETKIRGCAYLPSSSYEPGVLKPATPGVLEPATNYHFRIISEDAQGSRIVSDDYTFTTGL